jgi:hypothetical protein
MPTHVALLRGINVGGRNRVAMADLREVVLGRGHTEVATCIQSGNVVFTSEEADTATIAAALERAIAEHLGVRPKVITPGGSMRSSGTVPGPFDVALDYPRRDELEIIGTAGKVRLPDPWLCRRGYIELDQGDGPERLAADPTGEYQLGDYRDPDNDDAYRIEFETASRAIATGAPPAFGRADAINQAATIEAVRTAATTGTTVTLPTPTTG